MIHQRFKKGLAFILSLAMVFTTLFGGLGFLGIKGMVGEAYAATTRTTALNLTTTSTQNNTSEGWEWDSSAQTLTLSGININCSGDANCIGMYIPSGTAIYLVGDNNIKSVGTATMSMGIYAYGNVTISGTGSLTVTSGNISTDSCSTNGWSMNGGSLTVNSGTVNITAGNANSGTNGFSVGINGSLIVNDGTVTVTGGTANGSGSMSTAVSGAILTMNGGALNASGGESGNSYGINKNSIAFNGGTTTASSYSGGTSCAVYGSTISFTNGQVVTSPVGGGLSNTGQFVATVAAGTTKSYSAEIRRLSSAKAITAFDFNGLTPAVTGVVNEGSHTVALTVPYGADVTSLTPTITHTGVSISPASGTAKNFSSPVTYTVTAEDTTTQQYVVTVTVAANAWDGTTPSADAGAGFSGGDGSAATPYLIDTPADLTQLMANVNAGTTYGGVYFKMTSDIVLNDGTLDEDGDFIKTGDSTTSAAFSWTPIGTSSKPFQGTFDGDDHTVSGIYINNGAANYQGLFGKVYTGGTISNTGIKNSYIKGQDYVGGVAGNVYYATVTNCCNEGTIVSSGKYTGGVCGLLDLSTMTDCYNKGSVQSDGQNLGGVSGGVYGGSVMMGCYNLGAVKSTIDRAGGVAGDVFSNSKIIGCYNQGPVTSTGTGSGIGGVLGTGRFATIENCYNTGTVDASSAQDVGGITGGLYSKSMTNCYNTALVQGSSNAGGIAGCLYSYASVSYCYYNMDSYTGSMVGAIDLGLGTVSATSTSKSAIEMKSAAFVTLLNDKAALLNPSNGSHFYWFSDTGSVNSGYPVLDKAYAITFNSNSGTTEASPTYALAVPGGTVTLPTTNPTRTGYTFDGWCTSGTGGTEFTSATAVNADQTVFAHWLSSNANLYLLKLSSGTLSPSFASGTVSYSAIVSSTVSSITVRPYSPYYSTFMVSGSAVTNDTYSPPIPLSVGDNIITIVVTSQDATATKTYTVTVTRATPTYTIASIGNQTMTGLTAGYGAGTQETKTLTITRTGTGDLASLATTLGGVNASSFTITQPLATTLNSGTTSTTFTVQAKDGLTAGTYTATVTVSAVGMTDKSFLVTQVVSSSYHAVTSISGAPTSGTAGTEIDLTSATVSPSDATNKTIAWSVKDAGTTGVTTSDLSSGKFTPSSAGTLVVTATITNGATASTNYTQDVTITVNAAGTDIYSISADTALINFGSLTTGYASAPASRTVTITNTGNQSITLTEPATTNPGSDYSIGNLSSTKLATGSSVTFTVQPKTGLATGTYNETISISGTSGAAASVSVQFSVTAADNGGNGGHHSTSRNTGTVTDTVPVSVNGQSQAAGTVSTSKEGKQTVTTVTVDDAKIQEMINAEGNKSIVSIPISGSANIGQGLLNGQTVKDMEKKESILEIKTASATYTLPASEIDIDSVSSQLGRTVELKDIIVSVKIAEPSDNIAKVVQDTADKNKYQVVVKPVNFEITCTNGSKTVTVSKFNNYVERMVAIPNGTDPSKVTTGIVLNSDGTFYHVPTAIVQIDGKYYVKINSLTNSTYSVIYNPVAFADVTKHWAKDSIDNMGSRLVISGVGDNNFDPNRDITRAEFAAIMVRALGLAPDASKNIFSDVSDSKWYSGYVGTAASYGIITGTDADSFAPNAKITREQAMTMVARAMAITGLDAAAGSDASAALAGYTDTVKISSYAKAGIAACINAGVVTGKTADTIAPKNNITRAEVAVIIEGLLRKSELI